MATEVLVNDTEIKEAMSVLGIDHWVDDLMDEIELKRRLKISLEQADRGELRPTEMIINEIREKILFGIRAEGLNLRNPQILNFNGRRRPRPSKNAKT